MEIQFTFYLIKLLNGKKRVEGKWTNGCASRQEKATFEDTFRKMAMVGKCDYEWFWVVQGECRTLAIL